MDLSMPILTLIKRIHRFLLLGLVLVTTAFVQCLAQQENPIYLINIDAAIGPASHDYLQQSMREAHTNNAHLIIIHLDTPGGLVSSMREMTQEILNSDIPTVVYVSPSGSNAASAGAFIVYSAHIASMAPGTNIGAASPVSLGSDSPMPKDPTSDAATDNTDESAASQLSTAQKKAIEDLSAYMRSLADTNNRNSQLGVEMITKGSSFSAQEALQQKIVNFISTDLKQLVNQLNGYEVTVKNKTITLNTTEKPIIFSRPSWRYDFLSIITNPNITYVLLIAGIYGILFELYSPGSLFPGILGVICLILSGYGLHLLPINYAGLFLVILGVVMIVAETFVTSYGILGIGGFIAFVIGSIFLLDTLYPVYSVSRVVIGIMAVLTASILSIITNFVFGSLRRPHITGGDGMVGKTAYTLSSFDEYGQVECEGCIYSASTKTPLKAKQKVIVTEVNGIKLSVKPKDL